MFEKENAGDGNVALGANYAAREAGVLLVGAAGYAMAAMTMPQIPVALAVTAACLALGGVCRLPPAVRQMTFESRLIGDRKPYCLHSELVKLCRNESIDGRWVGFGFLWGTPQCQRVQELLCTDWKEAYHSSLTRAKDVVICGSIGFRASPIPVERCPIFVRSPVWWRFNPVSDGCTPWEKKKARF